MWLPFFKNKSQLHRLLIIDNPRKESIYSIVGRMEVLIDMFSKRHELRGLLPFLKTYYFVTRQAGEKYILYKEYFDHPKDYEILDIYFASLYFKPLYAYLEEHAYHKPWQHYFHYTTKSDALPILQILLGINAHINTDLYASLVHLKYDHTADYLRVNTILKEVMPDVLRLLAKEHDLVGLSGLMHGELIHTEFKTIIERWRLDAWQNAQRTTSANAQIYFRTIANNTEAVAEQLVKSADDLTHFKHVLTSVIKLHTLSVQVLEPHRA